MMYSHIKNPKQKNPTKTKNTKETKTTKKSTTTKKKTEETPPQPEILLLLTF